MVADLPGQDADTRLAAARAIRRLGLEPVPHISARRIAALPDLERILERAVAEAAVERCLVIAGDRPGPAGPFGDSLSLIATGLFERFGIKTVGVGGHPEGHRSMSPEQGWSALEAKYARIEDHGMSPLIVTQFGFDADAVLAWLETLRARGLSAPVRIGVPGPADATTLLRFAAQCGVGASSAALAKYGLSIGRLLEPAGPDRFVDRLAHGLTEQHGCVRLHVYPFGGLARTIDWIERYARHA